MLYKKINRQLLNNTCMLISVGLIMLVRLNFSAATKQLIIAFVSFVIAGLIPFVIKRLRKIPVHPYLYAFTGIGALLLVLIMSIFTEGSAMRISLWGFSVIPSEFVKILYVLFISCSLYKKTDLKTILITSLLAAVHVLILAASNDLGSAFLLFAVYVLMIFVATRKYKYLFLGAFGTITLSVASCFLINRIRHRVLAFLNPFDVIDNEGYQITQSLFAISNGSWFGVGLYNGTPSTIPYVETDLIFSIISQEMGIIVSACVVLICLNCFLLFIDFSVKTASRLYRMISFGLGITYAFQIFLSVAGVTRFFPLSGVTFPLVSHGGSSVMATLIAFFLLQGMIIDDSRLSIKLFDDETNRCEKDRKRLITAIFSVTAGLYLVVITFFSSYATINREKLINNPYNPYQNVIISKVRRGTIYSRDYEILAQTVSGINKPETRIYPFDNMFSHIVGYCGKGSMGIESTSNYYLINSNQPISDRITADMRGEKYIGDSVQTTLDIKLQKLVYDALGTYSGAVVVSDAKTGEVLSLVSKPDFNPNEINEIWDNIINDKESSVLVNRITQGKYDASELFDSSIFESFVNKTAQKKSVFDITQMTPMQVNMLTATVAREGDYIKPSIVKKVLNSNMIIVKEFDTYKEKTVLTKEECDTIGKAFSLNDNIYCKSVFVKGQEGHTSEHLWYTGYAPFEDSAFCVTIIVENAGLGNRIAQDIANNIFSYCLAK